MTRLILPVLVTLILALTPPAHAEFVRGIYTFSASTYDTIVSLGFNMVVSGPAWETELVKARQLGLKVIPSWYGDDTTAYDLMRSLDTDPMIMAWYPFDEPDIYHYSKEVVRDKIAILRRNNLKKPVYLTVFSPLHYSTYLPSADIFGITPYPIGSNPERINMDIVGRYTRRARILAPDKPLLVCIPAFFQRPWQYRSPDPEELHNIVYQALTGYPDGVIFFIWQVQSMDGEIWNLDQHPDLLEEMGVINSELIELDEVLTKGEPVPDATVSPHTVYQRVSSHRNAQYWIMANPYADPVTATLALPGKVTHARIMFGRRAELGDAPDSRTIAVNLGALGYATVRIEAGR